MKINLNIEEYDVKSLSTIKAYVESIQKKCNTLEQMATVMERNISIAERDFTSENMLRAKEIMQKYITRLAGARVEFTELLRSVDEFAAKLEHAWRNWD